MNTSWLTLSKQEKTKVLENAFLISGLPAIAIEKDWWVTLALQACFSLPYSHHIIFKGGTSLSKGWNLIDRFSEDIDLAMDRKFFGFEGDISKTQIQKLRRKSCEFISTTFLQDLKDKLTEWSVMDDCLLQVQPATHSDKDPQIIEIVYNSVLGNSDYLPQRVLIETGCRSLMEPTEHRSINAVISESFPNQPFANPSFYIPAVLPQRTFLEKIFLLHEEFSQNTSSIRVERLSRHLFDLEKLMDVHHGTEALQNTSLYESIVQHRKKFNTLRGLDYAYHAPQTINIIPPASVIKEWERDYQHMVHHMVYGKALRFNTLIDRIATLQKRINTIAYPH